MGRGRQSAARSVSPRQAAMARGETKLAALQQTLAGPRGCGLDSRVLEDLPHGRRRELVSQADQFAVDAPVAPAQVVPGHFQHQRPGPRDPGLPGDGARIRPVPPDQAGVPAQQGPRETVSRSWRSCLRGTSRASAARTARSAHHSRGVLTWRRSTATWCRKINISASLARSERASWASQPNTRSTAR